MLFRSIDDNLKRIFPENEDLLDRSNTIRMIKEVDNGEIWIGTRKGGLYVYDKDFKLISANKNMSRNYYDFAKDTLGNLWIGTRGDGIIINENNVYKGGKNQSPNNNIFAIKKDNKGRMWIGSFGGGLYLAEKTHNGYKYKSFFNQLDRKSVV